jgi:hypothetical protein
MPALLEAWPESPTSIGQNAGQDNGSDLRPVWVGLFFYNITGYYFAGCIQSAVWFRFRLAIITRLMADGGGSVQI